MDKIYLIRGNDTPLSVCLRKSEGEGDPVPYDLSTAERMRLALVGHGMHVFAEDIAISGEDDNIVSGVIPGRSLLKGDYDLEVTFNLDGRDKRFAVKDMFEAVDFLADDADGEAEGEGAGIFVTVTVQPELIEISGPTGPQGKSAYQVWLDDGHTGTEDDFFEWLAAQTPNPDWNQNDSTEADFIKNRTHYEETSTIRIDNALLAWSGSTSQNLDFWFHGTNVHIPRTSTGWGLTWQGGKLFIDDNGFGYELGVYNGEEWSINPFDPSYDQQPYPLNVDVVIASGTTVHKLDNKFLDMDSEPTTGSGKPVTSGGVKAAIADFVTRAVNDLLNYYTKTETYTKTEVNQLVAGINNWEIVPVAQLPEASADTMHKIYLVPSSNPKTKNVKDEFITVEDNGSYSWEQIGTTAIDLTNYVTKQELTAALADYVTSTAFTQALALKQDVIDDLPAIRQGASLGATAYQKPANGIPADDLEEGVIPDTSRLAEKDGYYPEMSVGSLKGTEVTQVEGITTIAKSTGIAKINEVMGRSLVWNQMVEDTAKDLTYDGAHTSYDPLTHLVCVENVSRETQYSSGSIQIPLSNDKIISGHKYIALSDCAINGISLYFYLSSYQNVQFNTIYTATADGTRINLLLTNQLDFPNDLPIGSKTYFHVRIYDLTQLFQPGNEPSTVAEFESWLANNIGYRDYYAYNAGEIISNNTEALEITGLNQWDEEIEIGTINESTGNNASASNRWRSKNYISVLPNTNYYFYNALASNSNVIYIFAYDADKKYIGCYKDGVWKKDSTISFINNVVIKTPSSCCYIRIMNFLGGTYQNNICINISGSRDGEYEPYQKSELELNLATITGKLNGEGESVTIFPDGMRSAGTAFDSLIVDEDGWCRKAVRNCQKIILTGEETYIIANSSYLKSDATDAYINNASIPITSIATMSRGRVCCTHLIGVSKQIWNTDGYPDTITLNSTSGTKQIHLNISNSRTGIVYGTDTTGTAKTKIAEYIAAQYAAGTPVTIVAWQNPQEYVLDTPIQMTFQAKHGGVIRQLPENGSEPTTAPMRMSVTYALPAEALISGASLENLLNALKTANKISNYTMTYNPTSGKWEFTIS